LGLVTTYGLIDLPKKARRDREQLRAQALEYERMASDKHGPVAPPPPPPPPPGVAQITTYGYIDFGFLKKIKLRRAKRRPSHG
jgi:hypothetical protein